MTCFHATLEPMAIEVEICRCDVGIILQVSGRLDVDTVAEFDRSWSLAVTPGLRNLVLDFSALVYIGSAGLGSVLSAGKAMEGQGGRLLMCGLAGRLRQIFQFSGLDPLFPNFESREAALNDCRQKVDAAHH